MDVYERELRKERARKKRIALLRRRIILFCTFCAAIFIGVGIIVLLSNNNTKKKELLQNYYEDFLAKQELNDSSEKKDSFADWFYDTYSKETIKKLNLLLENDSPSNLDIYNIVGESMFVLYDRYQGLISDTNQIYERTGKNSTEAEITIAGDLCFAEDGFILDHYDTVNDLSKCISPELLDIMNESDLFYLNHEYCISDRGTPLTGKLYTFRANPDRMELLEQMGTDLVSLANNHVYDYGADALLDTCDILENSDIPYVGGGRNLAEANRAIYFIVNGIKIGFVAASNAEYTVYTPQAEENSPGILSAYDTTAYNKVIQETSKKCDYLITYIHWGTEDYNYMNQQQMDQGREFLNSGADIVIGGHPHVLQGIEYVDGKPIVYSLGDFWFNSETKYTGLVKLNIGLEGLNKMSFIPCLQTEYTTQYLKTTEEQEELFSFLEDLSINIDIDSNGIITESK